MAISYSCPHCGKQSSVAEQYAGQTGPCAACGKQITIPMLTSGASKVAPVVAAGMGAGAVIAIVIASCLVVMLMCGGILLALLLPAVQATREAARRVQSMNNMKQLSLAMLNYHDVHGCFPPAVVTDSTGKPLYSGRVLLLPYMEQQHLYDQWQKDQPWDSPANQQLSRVSIPTFRDPSAPPNTGAQTDYLFVTGPGTVMEPNPRGMKMADIADGTSNTLMMVEFKGTGVNWAEPRDFDITAPKPLPPGNHPNGNIVVMYDGSVRFISKTTDPALIHKLATRAGGEVVP
jgi:hypothetical protein